MNEYIVKTPDGKYSFVRMYDKMDAILNRSDMGFELESEQINLGSEDFPELHEVIELRVQPIMC